MDMGAIVLGGLALGLIAHAWRKAPSAVPQLCLDGLAGLLAILPRFLMAVVTAGFVGKLLPGDLMATLIGRESGCLGILTASILGGFVPGGPIISFPVVIVLKDLGAGQPQLIAFLTAWSVLALHRVLMFEAALMGWRFSGLRLAASLILAPIAGGFAAIEAALSGH